MRFETDAQKVFASEKVVPFEVQDPFNPNTLRGFICDEENEFFGSMYLTHINQAYHPQTILCTPRIHYPWVKQADGRRIYHFIDCRKIIARVKEDGSNILGYIYTDGHTRWVTYKTRLCPILRAESRWHNWVVLWNIILQKYPDLPKTVLATNMNFSFELYGKQNPHTITYQHDLDIAMLFRIDPYGRLFAPLDSQCLIPSAKILATCDPQHLVRTCESLQEELENRNKASIAAGQGYICEGAVLNLVTTGGVIRLFKLKPETIQALAFSTGGGLSKKAVEMACQKVLESSELTLENLKTELASDFDVRLVDGFLPEIESVMKEMMQQQVFKDQVLTVCEKMNILEKKELMKKMSEQFGKQKSREIFAILKAAGKIHKE